MGTPIRHETPFIIRHLEAAPKEFSFVQAVRLLSLYSRRDYATVTTFLRQGLKVIPQLSLGHPGSDLVAVEELKEEPDAEEVDEETPDAEAQDTAADSPPNHPAVPLPRYTVVATFLSLYGVASPLPTFYTEELLDEARNDESACRDFLDIFNQNLYTLYYRVYNTGKIGLRTIEQQDQRMSDLQYCLLGLGDADLRRDADADDEDLRFISLFIRHTRSAQNLERYLSLRLGFDRPNAVEVEQCVPRYMTIPEAQQFRLGSGEARLGEGVIGMQLLDYEGKFRIHLHDLDADAMAYFQPGGKGRRVLEKAVRLFLNVPLLYDIVLHAKALSPTNLGVPTQGRLGVNAFLAAPEQDAALITHYRS